MKKQEILYLSESLKSYFNDFLSKYDFLFLIEKLEKYHIECFYRKEELYIKLEINLYPDDYPHFFRIILGQGSIDFPESDWNSTALWRIGQLSNPSSQFGYYIITNINEVKSFLKKALDDLEIIGKDFLLNDLENFIVARRKQNINREPYKIYSKGDNKKLKTEYDPDIIELKRKYS